MFNELPTRNDLMALLRKGGDFIEYLRMMKRLYPLVTSKTPQQWVLTEYPSGYSISGTTLRDTENNPVRDVAQDIQVWSFIQSAIVAWRTVVAVLENEASFRDANNQSVLKTHHRYFLDFFLPFDRRGEI